MITNPLTGSLLLLPDEQPVINTVFPSIRAVLLQQPHVARLNAQMIHRTVTTAVIAHEGNCSVSASSIVQCAAK